MYDSYTVKENDTLESLARKFNISVYDIIRLNGLENIYELAPGMTIQIPENQENAYIFYTVKKGDSLYSIAKDHNIKPEYIILLNGLNTNEYIYPNQQILLPKENIGIYLTKPGDTLKQILENTRQRPEDLLVYNDKIYLLPEQLIAYQIKN